ncbi:winged helix-turn-helix transcriptional regulator [Candidatus Woesearchaeota archaeon]|nr:winged helix-turn-helix transcriptional regulator [Candidatus Woesearchaeota archaeon]
MKCRSYKVFFEVIANKTRIEILELLVKKQMCVTDICNNLEEEQSKISHNLRKLTQCHFVDVKRDGKKRIYSLNKETILPLMELVEKHVSKYCGKECRAVK